MSYFEKYKDIYIKDFAKAINEQRVDEFTEREAISIFKHFMWFSKNIKVDMRKRFWKEIFSKGMKKADYRYFGRKSYANI